MATKPTYIDIIADYWPDLNVQTSGDPYDYDALQSDQPIPTKEELDSKSIYVLRKAVWKEIQERRDFRKGAGVKIGGNWFHSDDTSRIQQIALVMLGANMPPGIMWKTMQGTFVEMTPQLAGQIFQTIIGSDKAVFGKAESHRQAMILSETPPEQYDYTTGWPMIYSESPEAAALADYQ